MDYADLLDGLVPDLEQATDELEPNADLPTELVLVEDGEPQSEAIARLDYLRDYSIMVYGNALVEVVERDDDAGRLVVTVLDATSVSLTVENDTEEVEVRRDGTRVENVYVDSHSGEQDHYGESPVEAVADEANVLSDLTLDSIALSEEGYENSELGPLTEDHGEQ